MATVGELFIELGLKADKKAFKDIKTAITGLRTGLILVQGAFIGAVAGLDRFVDSSLRGVVALENVHKQTGLAVEGLQKWQQAGQLSNLALSADQISSSIANVQKNLAQIRLGQGNIQPFQLLGINVKDQDAFNVLEELRSNIKDIDPAIASNLLGQIGLTPDFLNLLQLSRKEFELISQNTFLGKKQRADIDRVGTSFKQITLTLKALKDQAVAKLAPALNDLAQDFFKFLKDNGTKIINVIAGLARAFANFTRAVGNAFVVAANFIENIVGFENGLKTLSIAFGALALSISPFLLALGSIVLLLDDFAVFKAGGESLLGDFFASFEKLSDLPDFVKLLGGAAAIGLLTKLSTIIKIIAGGLLSISKVGGIAGALGLTALLSFKPQDLEPIIKAIKPLQNTLADPTSIAGFSKNFLLPALQSNLFGGNQSPKTTTINNNVSVNGVQQPQEVGAVVDRTIKNVTTENLKRVQALQNNDFR